MFVCKESVFYSANNRGILKIFKEESDMGFFFNDLNEKERNKALGFKTSNTERWASESLAGVWGMSVCEDSLKESSGSRQTCWCLLLLPCSQIQSGSQEWFFTFLKGCKTNRQIKERIIFDRDFYATLYNRKCFSLLCLKQVVFCKRGR